jgi:hypothetical protein
MYRFLPTSTQVILLNSSSCFAVPFALIVPAEVTIRTPTSISGVGTPWGWVVATDTPLTHDDFQFANISLWTDNPSVTVSAIFNPPLLEPLLPGEVSGLDVSPFTDPLRALLQPGEVVNPFTSNNWRWDIFFPPGFVGEANLHTVLEMDGAAATFDTLLRLHPTFGTDMDPLGIERAQRVTAIPEPSTLILSIAAIAFLPLRRRKSVPHNRV